MTVSITDVNERPDSPAAPTVSSPSSTSLKATWVTPDNEGRPPITGYVVQYREKAEAGMEVNAWKTSSHTGTGTENTITGLEPSTTYEVQIKTVNHEGQSDWSPTGEGTTKANVPPSFTDSSSTSRTLAENTPAGSDVGDPVSATDEESASLTYTLSGTDATSFQIASDTGQISTASGTTFNYESDKTSYSVIVTATDGHSGSANIAVTISVTDVDEPPETPAAPTVTAGAQPRSLNINWAAPANTGPAINDYDLQYRQVSTPPWLEWPHSDASRSAVITGLMAGKTYEVQVKAGNLEGESGWSTSGTGATTQNVSPVFDDSGTASRSIAETIGSAKDSGRNVGSAISATDTDGGTIAYSISGADAGNFTVNDATGQLRTKTDRTYDHETKSTYSLTVTADDGQEEPHNTSDIDVTISVTDVNEPPVKMAAPTLTDTGRDRTTVNWSPPVNTGRPELTGYQVGYTLKDDEENIPDTPDTLEDVALDENNELQTLHAVTGLDDGKTYNFQVRGVNDEGEGPWSDAGSVDTPANNAPEFSDGSSTSRDLPENSARTPEWAGPWPPPMATPTPSPTRSPGPTRGSSPWTPAPVRSRRGTTTTTTRPPTPTR